jgi:predicted metal-dependent peptidase
MDEQLIERATEKITRARFNLIIHHPFFGMLALKLKLKPDPTHNTAWTDGVSIGFNPAWIDGLTFPQTVGLVAHEVLHVSNLHHIRRQWREHKRWNYAGDYVINLILQANNFELPPKGLLDAKYNDMAAEHVYAALAQDGDGDDSQDTDDQGGEDTDDQGNSTDSEDTDDQGDEDSQDGDGDGQDSDSDGQDGKSGNDGDGDGGSGEMGEDPAGWGEVRDLPNPEDPSKPATEDQKKRAENDTIIDVMKAYKQAEGVGKAPAGMEELVEALKEPAVDWREKLALFMTRYVKNDYTWMRGNHRHLARGVYLPSLHNPEVGNLVVAVDTSGSTLDAREQFASELNAILDLFDVEVDVLYCDTHIPEDGHEHYEKCDLPLTLKMIGGGGTDICPPFEWVKEHWLDPTCLIYLTDMEFYDYPAEDPPYPVLWVNCRPRSYRRTPPPFGEIVDMDI